MIYVWASLLILLNVLWLGLTLVGLPGNWLMIGTALVAAWWVEPAIFSDGTLIAVAVLAVVGEVVELVAGAAGSRKAGGSRRASIGALGGGIIGAIVGTVLIPIPIIGTLAGAAGGAFGGAAAMELTTGRSGRDSVRVGRGAMVGHITGNLSKLVVGAVIWGVLAIGALN